MQNIENIRINKLIARLYKQTPVIGRGLRRSAAKALIKTESSQAMNALAEAFIQSYDKKIQQIALNGLLDLAAAGNSEAQGALCRLVIEHNHPVVREIVLTSQYTPSDPQQRALFIKKLVEILLHSNDPEVQQSILKGLEQLAAIGKQEAREALCRLVIEHDHPLAREIVLAAQYAPRDPYQRALFYVLTAQWEQYEQFDFDHHWLRTLYRTADRGLQRRIVASTRQEGRVDLLASFVTGGKQADRMTNKDWETMVTTLDKNGEWEEMWRLAQTAPAIWSVQLLLRLKKAKWMPTHATEQAEFTKLVQLAEECHKKEDTSTGWLVYCHAALEGHTDDIRCLTFSPDGQVLASGSNDNTIRLWNLPDGAALKTLGRQTQMLATYLPYWEYRRRAALKTLKGHTRTVTCLAISPDGQILATGGGDNSVRLWTLPGGMALQTLRGHTDYVACLTISSDGRVLVSGSHDHSVRLWNLSDGATIKTLTGFTEEVRSLVISPDRQILASGSDDWSVRLWSLPDGTALHTLKGHTCPVISLAISPNGRMLASGDEGGTVRLWSLPDGAAVKTLKGHSAEVSYLVISPDGRMLASGSYDRTIRLWTLPEGIALKTLEGHTAGICCLAIGPDGLGLASGGFDKTIRLWVLGKVDLSRLNVAQISLKEFRLLQERFEEEEATDDERTWLEFLLRVIYWNQRFDVEIDEASKDIPHGKFDIEIERV